MKLFTRLALMKGFFSIASLAIGSLGLYGIRTPNEALRAVYEGRTVPVEQLGEIGAAQVSDAVAQMDQATPQNAALVEQIAAASGLRSLTHDRVGTVAVFVLAHKQKHIHNQNHGRCLCLRATDTNRTDHA